MKKIFLSFFVILLTSIFAFAEDTKISLPNDVSPYAFIIDKNEMSPIPKDNFKISTYYNVKGLFEIYACNDTQNWTHLGNIDFPKYADTKTLKTKEKVKNFRYYCIDFKEEKIEYEVISRNNDIILKAKKNDVLKINDQIIDKGFFVLDYSDIDADDYFKLENTTSKSNFKIKLYVFDINKENWKYAGEGSLKGYGDVDTIRSDVDVDDYKIVALVSENKMNFTCRAYERNSDLYIELCDTNNETDSSDSAIDNDIEEKLKTLKNLYDKGYIDEEEYKLKKSQILGL